MVVHHEGEAAGKVCEFVSSIIVRSLTYSRLGLRLTDRFAREHPAWLYLRDFSHNRPEHTHVA
jgi:hypothetical protein